MALVNLIRATDLNAVRRERAEIKAELAKLEAQMDAYLKELGYAQ